MGTSRTQRKRQATFAAASLAIATFLSTSASATPHAPRLLWADAFRQRAQRPNPHVWGYEIGKIRNRELQYYTDRLSNARIQRGMLLIETRKEAYRGAAYTSASLTTLGHEQFLYGRIEVRAQIPTSLGTWPAIWLMGVDRARVGWPRCGEIDVMEHVGFRPNTIFGTIHRPGKNLGGTIQVPNPGAGFHTYGIDWTRNVISFFVDGKTYFTYPIRNGTPDGAIFRKPFYLIVNAAYGGTWGGAHGVNDAALPARYRIDWIRYYSNR